MNQTSLALLLHFQKNGNQQLALPNVLILRKTM